jgi:hypothetical protein
MERACLEKRTSSVSVSSVALLCPPAGRAIRFFHACTLDSRSRRTGKLLRRSPRIRNPAHCSLTVLRDGRYSIFGVGSKPKPQTVERVFLKPGSPARDLCARGERESPFAATKKFTQFPKMP